MQMQKTTLPISFLNRAILLGSLLLSLVSVVFSQDGLQIASIVDQAGPLAYITSYPGGNTNSWTNSPGTSSLPRYLAADFLGTGKSSLVCVDFDTNYQANVFSTSSESQRRWESTIAGPDENIFYLLTADFSGDGLDDLAAFYTKAGQPTGDDVYVRFAFGPNGENQTFFGTDWLLPAERDSAFVRGKFAGNGQTNDSAFDIMAVNRIGSNTYTAKIYKGPNGILSSTTPWTISLANSNWQPVAFRAGDYNADGFDDLALVFYAGTPSSYYAVIALGADGSIQRSWSLAGYNYTAFLSGDFNGDGITDIAAIYEPANQPIQAVVHYGSPSGEFATETYWTLGGQNKGSISYLSANFENLCIDTDGDGIPDYLDPDDDNDGVPDVLEIALGLNPKVADTDGDDVEDGNEITDGTNPLDRGSFLPVLNPSLCFEWNGFLNMWNIAELVNMSQRQIVVDAVLYNVSGQPQGVETFRIERGRQFDLLVHDMQGWTRNSYGKVCATVREGSLGELDGRIVYYKESESSSAPNFSFEFAFAIPFQNGIKGKQWVPFNTYQPSLDPRDDANMVANWIQITNLAGEVQTGLLSFYSEEGTILATQQVTLEPSARRDFSGHRFGKNLVGTVEWMPNDNSALFQLRNVRYLYNNIGTRESFDSAFQLEGLVGSGELLAAPLDTRQGSSILEITNTLTVEQEIVISIYNEAGTLQRNVIHTLPAHGSVHVITDEIVRNGLGMASIQGSAIGGLIAVVMQYERTERMGIKSVYGIPARQALGNVLRSSYNTFLNQSCLLYLVNPTTRNIVANISMARFDGTVVLAGHSELVPSKGVIGYNLCQNEIDDVYGVVTIQPDHRDSIVSSLVRVGNHQDYRFAQQF